MSRIEKVLQKLNKKQIKDITDKAVTYFSCKRSLSIPLCRCGKNKSTSKCEYPLRGSKEGQTCDRLLCELCGETINDKTYCRIHANMIRKENES